MTSPRDKTSFYVNGTVEGEQRHVIGRCGDSPIRRGEVFVTACRYKSRERLQGFATPPELVASTPVSLHVIDIQAYDRHLDELGAGMTGSLILDGEGFERVGPGTILEAKAGAPVE
jgi:hypothetical protein